MAISNAREMVADAAQSGPETRSTLALRLLNCGLWHLGEKRIDTALQFVNDAVNVTDVPKTLSAIALAISASASDAQTLGPFLPALTTAVDKALRSANLSGGALEVSDAAWLGDLCCACCNMGGCGGDAPLAWACFGLLMIPRMSEKVLLQLSLHLKAGQPGGVLPLLDESLRPPVGPYDKWPAGPVTDPKSAYAAMHQQKKAVVFLIDRTWEPMLEACINATAMVFNDHLDSDDQVAMYSLGYGWIFPMQAKGTGAHADGLHAKVLAAKECKGSCILYESMQKVLAPSGAFGKLMNDKSYSAWLIVLTDLVDLKNAPSAPKVRALIKTMSAASGFNLAIIDSQTISGYEPRNQRWPEWRANCKRMVDEVAASGNKSYHIEANSAAEITSAFQRVASLMSVQVNEVL